MTIAHLALAEFHRRKTSIDEAVAMHRFGRDQGEANLACWLAIAVAVGVPPRECTAALADWQQERALGDSWARHIILWEGPPEAEWRAELARACVQARSRMRNAPGDADALRRHLALDCIAAHLHAGAHAPMAPAEMKEAA